MNIFENLENLNVSEECFQSILSIIEEYINEISKDTVDNLWDERLRNTKNARSDYDNIYTMDSYYTHLRNPKLKSPKRLRMLDKLKSDAYDNYQKELNKQHKTEKRVKSWAKKVKGEDAYLSDKYYGRHDIIYHPNRDNKK